MALESRMYRDPMLVAMENEERRLAQERRRCGGCIFKARVFGLDYCTKERTPPGDRMRRCDLYQNTGGKAC